MLLKAVTVSQTFLLFNDLDSFEEYWWGILYNSPVLECFWYSWLEKICVFIWKKTIKVESFFKRRKGAYYQYNLSLTVHVNLDLLVESLKVRFQICYFVCLVVSFSLIILQSLCRNCYVKHTLRELGVILYFLEDRLCTWIIWMSSAKEICLFSILRFNHIFTSVPSQLLVLHFGL